MAQPTILVKNAVGADITVNTINPNGQDLAANSQAVVLPIAQVALIAQEAGGNLAAVAASVATTATNTTGAATAAKQDTGNTSLASIATNTTGAATAAKQDTGNTSLASIATNTTGAATAAKQDTGNTSLASIDTKLSSVATAAKQDTGNTSLASIVSNTTGVASAGNQTTQIASLSTIATNTGTTATNTTGAATAAKQDTGNTSLASIATNTTGAATAAKQDTGNTSLATLAGIVTAAKAAVTIADGDAQTMGAKADASAGADTGTFSLIAFIKWIASKIKVAGQATMANSHPVTIASNQSDVPVNLDQIGGTGVTLGQKNSANSLSVILSSQNPTVVTQILADNSNVAVSRGAWTDASGTITAAGVSQVLVVLAASRNFLFFQNNSTEILWIHEVTAATASQPSISIPPGGSIVFSAMDFVTPQAINVIGATTGSAFTCKVNP